MMSLRSARSLRRVPQSSRHLATIPETKVKKKREDLHRYNKQSLIVYGPLVNSSPRKRNYKPVYYKDSNSIRNFDFIEAEIETETESEHINNLLPVLNIDSRGGLRTESLDLNELLAQPLIPGQAVVDPEIYRFHGAEKCERTLSLRKLPSVTRILDRTMPAQNRALLERWKKQQIELLGEEGFNMMQKETLRTGHQFHSSVHDFLSGQSEDELELTSQVRDGLWASVRGVLDDVTGVRFLEETIAHEDLLYSGIVDCVADYRDAICVIDWKTSKKRKKTLRQAYDNPIQLAAYAGALNSSRGMKTQQGVLVYAYPDGSPADVLSVPASKMHHYWLLWLQRLQTYWKMAVGNEI